MGQPMRQQPAPVQPMVQPIMSELPMTLNPESRGCSLDSGCELKNKHLFDPKYNLREVVKQMILLEDHMFQPEKRCYDCISKHTMTVEGYLQEAITLDKKQEHTEEIYMLLNQFIPIMHETLTKMKGDELSSMDYCRCAQQLRTIRKPMCQKYSNFNCFN
jgi:hypothetical protein